MCYLYDALHEMFDSRELNEELFKEFYYKYRDSNVKITYMTIKAIINRGWITKELAELVKGDYDVSDLTFDEYGKYRPFVNDLDFINFIKADDVDNFSNLVVNQKGEFNYSISYIMLVIFYYGAVKCLKFLLLNEENKKKFLKRYLEDINLKIGSYMWHEVHDNVKDYAYIANNNEIIKTIRYVFGFNKKFEKMFVIAALNSFNFNVLRNIETEFKNKNGDGLLSSVLKDNKSDEFGIVELLYKDFCDDEVIYKRFKKINECEYKATKEYIDYVYETNFNKNFDIRVLNIIIRKMYNKKWKIESISLDKYRISYIKKYLELFVVGFGKGAEYIDFKKNEIYCMMDQKNKDIIDMFATLNFVNRIGCKMYYISDVYDKIDAELMKLDKVIRKLRGERIVERKVCYMYGNMYRLLDLFIAAFDGLEEQNNGLC